MSGLRAESRFTHSCRGWVHTSCHSRVLLMVAVGFVIGLGTAGPALASDGQVPPLPAAPEPVVPVPAVPQPELPTIPVPDPLAAPGPDPVSDPISAATTETEAAPDAAQADPPVETALPDTPPAAPEVTTSTQSDGDNVNVSVRVNSPGDEAPSCRRARIRPWYRLRHSLISRLWQVSSHSNLTVQAAPALRQGLRPCLRRFDEYQCLGAGLEPRRQRSVTQTTASGDTQDESSGEDGAAPGDTVESTPDPLSDSSQYQDHNSQYQSTEPSPEDAPWNWRWTLTVCDGNVLSVSDESGSNSSRDWTWNWMWNWTCDEAPASSAAPPASPTDSEDRESGVPQSGPANVNVSIRVLSPGDDGAVTQTNTTPTPSPRESGAPSWVWAWTFTWCGTTTEISTLAGEGTGLDWDWNWLWLWDCAPTGETPPAPDNPPPSGVAATAADHPQKRPHRTARHHRARPSMTGATHRRRSRSRASPRPSPCPSGCSEFRGSRRGHRVPPSRPGSWRRAHRPRHDTVGARAVAGASGTALADAPRIAETTVGSQYQHRDPEPRARRDLAAVVSGATATHRPDPRRNDRDRDHHGRRDPGSARTDA